MTEWERSREREEFVRASILYRPSSSSLSSRFTRGKQEEDEDTVEVPRDQEVEGCDLMIMVLLTGKGKQFVFVWLPGRRGRQTVSCQDEDVWENDQRDV